MLHARNKGGQTGPFLTCDVCRELIQHDTAAEAWSLAPIDQHPHTAEVFFLHGSCTAQFLKQNPLPAGWAWVRLELATFLALLLGNTWPLVKKPRPAPGPGKGPTLQ